MKTTAYTPIKSAIGSDAPGRLNDGAFKKPPGEDAAKQVDDELGRTGFDLPERIAEDDEVNEHKEDRVEQTPDPAEGLIPVSRFEAASNEKSNRLPSPEELLEFFEVAGRGWCAGCHRGLRRHLLFLMGCDMISMSAVADDKRFPTKMQGLMAGRWRSCGVAAPFSRAAGRRDC